MCSCVNHNRDDNMDFNNQVTQNENKECSFDIAEDLINFCKSLPKKKSKEHSCRFCHVDKTTVYCITDPEGLDENSDMEVIVIPKRGVTFTEIANEFHSLLNHTQHRIVRYEGGIRVSVSRKMEHVWDCRWELKNTLYDFLVSKIENYNTNK